MNRQIGWKVFLLATAMFLPGPAFGQESVEYYHVDALGSVVAVTDEQRNIKERREYEPYGYQLTPALADGPGYSGHVQDAATGLTYMQQRYFDPAIGLFLSVDPVTAYADPVNQFNRYRYANHNPYRFVDPDGRYSCEPSTCNTVRSSLVKMRDSRNNLSGQARSRVTEVLRYIGSEGSEGPHYVADELKGDITAHTDQMGTTTIDLGKVDSAEKGAMVLGHEAIHDIDAIDRKDVATTVDQVRETEVRAYETEAMIGQGLNIDVSAEEQARGVADSVSNFESRQRVEEEK